MDIYECLQKDHRQFEALLDRLLEASKAGDGQWKAILDELRAGLIPHAHAEEAVFYNALRENDPGKKLVAHSYTEHLMAETEVRTLEGLKKIDANWTSGFEKLAKDLRHHIQDEESRVFSAARQIFSEEEARQIGEAFERLKPEMAKDAESMLASTLDLIANLLPKRLSEGFRKNFAARGGKAA